jgi:hypothetical protein
MWDVVWAGLGSASLHRSAPPTDGASTLGTPPSIPACCSTAALILVLQLTRHLP